MKATIVHKKEKFDRIFTSFLKISLLHSYKIYQNLQPSLDFGAPPKGAAPPPADQKFPSSPPPF